MALTLTLDAALYGCSAGVVRDGDVLAARQASQPRGQAAALPHMARQVLEEAGFAAAGLSCVAVTIGPGSFTGLRAALALAHGIGLAAGVPVAGVTVAEAFGADAPDGRALWVAIDTKRGLVFLDRAGLLRSVALTALPEAPGRVAVAGDAAIAVASRLAARGDDVQLLAARRPSPAGIAAAASRREAAGLPAHPAHPLYVDPPEARPGPRGRPAPA